MAGEGEIRGAGRSAQRSPDDIQRDIERSREALATSVDQLVFRTNPRRLADDAKQQLLQRAQTPAGRAVIAAIGGLAVVLVIKRVRRH